MPKLTDELETPPGFVLKNDLLKAADDLGYRIDEGLQGAWHKRASTTAQGSIFLAGESRDGPWYLGIENNAIVAEFNITRLEASDEDYACFRFETLNSLRAGIDRAYKLGVSLPNVPLDAFLKAIEGRPQNTEVERLVIQRIGQAQFREALLDYWDGRCCVTGIRDTSLLRASHIKPWARCGSDAERLDVHNGLLLSALWDAAFDKGLVTFDDQGQILYSNEMSELTRNILKNECSNNCLNFNKLHLANIAWHRENIFLK